MKLNYASFLTAGLLMVTGANANAGVAFDLYTGLTAGLGGQRFTVDDHHKSDSAKSFGVVAGVDIPFVRLEAEYNYMDGKNANIQIGALNAYVKMSGLTIITPYVGGGIGMIWKVDVDKDFLPFNYDETNKAVFQGMLGTTFDIPALPFKIDIEGRVMYAPKLIEIATLNETASGTHYDARVKLRYVF